MSVTVWHPGIVLPSAALSPEMVRAIKAALSPAQVVALTGWAEARSRLERGRWVGNPIDAMADVMCVIANRARDPRWQAIGPAGVCLQRWQFSCWEPTGGPDSNHDPRHLADNFEALLERAQRLLAGVTPTPKLASCLEVAASMIDGRHPDTVQRATHYYAEWMPDPPPWSFADPHTRRQPLTPVHVAYGHRFYAHIA